MRVNFVHIHDNNNDQTTKIVRPDYDSAVDDYQKILTYVNEEDFNYLDHLSVKPTTEELLAQRKTLPHKLTVGEFIDLTTLTKKYIKKSIFKLLAAEEEEQVEDIFPHSNRLGMYADDIVRFSKRGWLNNTVIDRSLAMFMQHLQACHLKDPKNDIRIKQYQIFYTDLMFNIRQYEQNTKIFYNYFLICFDYYSVFIY